MTSMPETVVRAADPPVDRAPDLGGALAVQQVAKAYGSNPALVDVSLRIDPGEVLGLLGPNGAGKSTLVSIVAGLLPADGGSVSVCGHPVGGGSLASRQLVGLAPQDLGLYLQLSVRANLRFFGEAMGMARSELKARIVEVSSALDLDAILDRKPHELSGGEKRRAHTAIAVLGRPVLLLLDEPTAGVDVHTRRRILEVVRALADDGAAVCYTTHYLHEAEEVADTATIIAAGEVVAAGSIDDLVRGECEPVLELTLEGEIPAELERIGMQGRDGSVVHLPAPDVGAAISRALAIVDHRRIRSIEVVQPSLENVYLNVTGRRIGADMAGKAAE
jgi:ABC-2 type transport system ATP-binding protein